MEFQTKRTPTEGKYYLYRGDQVVRAYAGRVAGIAAYRQLRHEIWCCWLAGTDPQLRLSAARGLWYHEKQTFGTVVSVLWQEGTERDRASLRSELGRLHSTTGDTGMLAPSPEPPAETGRQGPEIIAAQSPSSPRSTVRG